MAVDNSPLSWFATYAIILAFIVMVIVGIIRVIIHVCKRFVHRKPKKEDPIN